MQIVAEILTAASERSEGLTTTKFMYKARLSFSMLKDYLDSLVGDELLDYHSDTKRYTVTTKGFKFLSIYRNITELFPDVDLCDNINNKVKGCSRKKQSR